MIVGCQLDCTSCWCLNWLYMLLSVHVVECTCCWLYNVVKWTCWWVYMLVSVHVVEQTCCGVDMLVIVHVVEWTCCGVDMLWSRHVGDCTCCGVYMLLSEHVGECTCWWCILQGRDTKLITCAIPDDGENKKAKKKGMYSCSFYLLIKHTNPCFSIQLLHEC